MCVAYVSITLIHICAPFTPITHASYVCLSIIHGALHYENIRPTFKKKKTRNTTAALFARESGALVTRARLRVACSPPRISVLRAQAFVRACVCRRSEQFTLLHRRVSTALRFYRSGLGLVLVAFSSCNSDVDDRVSSIEASSGEPASDVTCVLRAYRVHRIYRRTK